MARTQKSSQKSGFFLCTTKKKHEEKFSTKNNCLQILFFYWKLATRAQYSSYARAVVGRSVGLMSSEYGIFVSDALGTGNQTGKETEKRGHIAATPAAPRCDAVCLTSSRGQNTPAYQPARQPPSPVKQNQARPHIIGRLFACSLRPKSWNIFFIQHEPFYYF